MPNIQEYVAPLRDIPQPTDRAVDTAREVGMMRNRFMREEGEALGGAISRTGAQLGEAVDRHMSAQQISHGAVINSTLFTDLTDKWNKLASSTDPNDTSIQQGFKETVLEPSLEKFQSAFENATPQAQEWALQRADQMRQHFFEKTSADMATRAGVAATQNIDTTTRNYSLAAAADPTALPQIAGQIQHDFDTLIQAHGLNAEQAAKIRSDIVPKALGTVAESAFRGMADKNPQGAIAEVNKGTFDQYWNAIQKDEAIKYADTMQKAKDADAKREQQQVDAERRQQSADRAEVIRQSMYDVNSGRIKPVSPRLNQSIINDPMLLPKDKTELIRWNQSQYKAQVYEDEQIAAGKTAVDNPHILRDLRSRVGDADNPTTRQEIVDALSGEQVTRKSAGDLMWRIGQADAAWQSVQRQFKPQFDNLVHATERSILAAALPPEKVAAAVNNYEADAQRILRQAYNNHEDMRPYFDPKSPQYILRNPIMLTTPKASISDQANDIRQAPATGTIERNPPQVFKDAEALNDAVKAGKVKSGDKLIVGGQAGVWK